MSKLFICPNHKTCTRDDEGIGDHCGPHFEIDGCDVPEDTCPACVPVVIRNLSNAMLETAYLVVLAAARKAPVADLCPLLGEIVFERKDRAYQAAAELLRRRREGVKCCGMFHEIIQWTDAGPRQYGAECSICGRRIAEETPEKVREKFAEFR